MFVAPHALDEARADAAEAESAAEDTAAALERARQSR
jgi:hypothetical protein